MHPNEILVCAQVSDGSFTYTPEGRELVEQAAEYDMERVSEFSFMHAFNIQFTRQVNLYLDG